MSSREPGYDPLKLTQYIEGQVVVDNKRRYYRFRPTRFYGGVATGDVVGCNLRCAFCWVKEPRENLRAGQFYSPIEAWRKLKEIADRHRYKYLRLSGGEPTIGFNHLVKLLEYIETSDTEYLFILETNGILIGAKPEFAKTLSRFSRVHVRVSIKACNEYYFHKVTGARPSSFHLQLEALRNLSDWGVSYHPAIVIGFGDEKCYGELLDRIKEIDPVAYENLEVEIIILYPHILRRLKNAGIFPKLAYTPDGRLIKD